MTLRDSSAAQGLQQSGTLKSSPISQAIRTKLPFAFGEYSRRRRLSSSPSLVVKPSLRRPSSSAACLAHLRIALADGSNLRASWLMLRPARASSMIRRRYSGAYGGWVDGIGVLSFSSSPTLSTKPGQLHLQNGGTLEHAQQIAAHESPRTTKLYDRTQDEISLDEVERIRI